MGNFSEIELLRITLMNFYCMQRGQQIVFLDERLRMNGNTNILQKNLFIILASKEMIAVSQFFSIIHVSIVIPFRWLSGNTHKLSEYNWGARSMWQALDMLHTICTQLLNDIGCICLVNCLLSYLHSRNF